MPSTVIIDQLLKSGGGEAHVFSGFLSRMGDGHVRIYQALSTESYIDLAQDDILHIEDQSNNTGESLVYVGADTDVRLVFERNLNVKDIRPVSERPETSSPDQSSGLGLSASRAGEITSCVGGFDVIFCAEAKVDKDTHFIYWVYKIRSVFAVCGPGHTYYLLC